MIRLTMSFIPRPPTSSAPPQEDLLRGELERIPAMSIVELRHRWRETLGKPAPEALTRDLMARILAFQLQEETLGGLGAPLEKHLAALARGRTAPARRLKTGSVLIREHEGERHEVFVTPEGYCWRGETFSSLSAIAKKITGVSWSGPRFFGLQGSGSGGGPNAKAAAPAGLSPAAGRRRSGRAAVSSSASSARSCVALEQAADCAP